MISGNPPRHLCSFVLEINFSFSCIDHSSYRYVRISDFFRFPFFIFITYLNHHLTHWLILIPMRQITFFDSFHHRILLIKIPPPHELSTVRPCLLFWRKFVIISTYSRFLFIFLLFLQGHNSTSANFHYKKGNYSKLTLSCPL